MFRPDINGCHLGHAQCKWRVAILVLLLLIIGTAGRAQAESPPSDAEYLPMFDLLPALCAPWDLAQTRVTQSQWVAKFLRGYGAAGLARMRKSPEYAEAYRSAKAELALMTPEQVVQNCEENYWQRSSAVAKSKLARLPPNHAPSTQVLSQSDGLPECLRLHGSDADSTLTVSNGCSEPVTLEYCWQTAPESPGWVGIERSCARTGWITSPTVKIAGDFSIRNRPYLVTPGNVTVVAATLSIRHVKRYKMWP